MRVLAQPASSSSCERNWSTYGFIHSKARNKLKHARADKLVRVHGNLKLLTKSTASDYKDAKVEWQYADSASEPSSEDSEWASVGGSDVEGGEGGGEGSGGAGWGESEVEEEMEEEEEGAGDGSGGEEDAMEEGPPGGEEGEEGEGWGSDEAGGSAQQPGRRARQGSRGQGAQGRGARQQQQQQTRSGRSVRAPQRDAQE